MTPESTAESETNRAPARPARSLASVVLPVPGPPQKIKGREGAAILDQSTDQLALADEVPLADELIEAPRAHPLGERGVGVEAGPGFRIGPPRRNSWSPIWP